ncbi:MAG: hypothetical protein KDE53_03310, partial [Caldilineaceae bacterium]|nr:hypothetical protein [Caldilineaceae bacterium]
MVPAVAVCLPEPLTMASSATTAAKAVSPVREPIGRGFTGEYFAPETGLWHLRARDLNPNLGRFLSADPVQPNAPGSQGFNVYSYV